MILLFAAAIAASQPAAPSAPGATASVEGIAKVQATASIRIISGAQISWGDLSPDLPKMRQATFRGTGAPQPIRLVEFE